MNILYPPQWEKCASEKRKQCRCRGIRKVHLKICHRILPSPRILENDLPETAKSRNMIYMGLADSGLSYSGIGQAPISHLL
jgi:hypothetical protein